MPQGAVAMLANKMQKMLFFRKNILWCIKLYTIDGSIEYAQAY